MNAFVTPKEGELRRILLAWWPAIVANDTAFFQRYLASEFVARPPTLHEGEVTKPGFITDLVREGLCGNRIVVQERGGTYRVMGSFAAVNVTLRIWLGEPIAPSWTDIEMYLGFVRRHGRWQVRDFWELRHQPPGWAWQSPYFAWRRPQAGEQGAPSGAPHVYSLPPCKRERLP